MSDSYKIRMHKRIANLQPYSDVMTVYVLARLTKVYMEWITSGKYGEVYNIEAREAIDRYEKESMKFFTKITRFFKAIDNGSKFTESVADLDHVLPIADMIDTAMFLSPAEREQLEEIVRRLNANEPFTLNIQPSEKEDESAHKESIGV